MPSVKFLGFLIFDKGKEPDPSKVEAMLRIPTQLTSKQLLSWVQTAYFYRRFISNFSKIAAPLQAVIRRPEFNWTPEFNKHLRPFMQPSPRRQSLDTSMQLRQQLLLQMPQPQPLVLSSLRSRMAKKLSLSMQAVPSLNRNTSSTSTFGKPWLCIGQ